MSTNAATRGDWSDPQYGSERLRGRQMPATWKHMRYVPGARTCWHCRSPILRWAALAASSDIVASAVVPVDPVGHAPAARSGCDWRFSIDAMPAGLTVVP